MKSKFSNIGTSLSILTALSVSACTAYAGGYQVNSTASPIAQVWNDTEAGWQITPTDSFTLESITSDFNYDDFGEGYFTCSVYSNAPSYLGGVLLTSGSSMKPDAPTDVTFTMNTPTQITAGNTYFIDFTGLYGQGINVTDDPGAVKPGTEYYTFNGQHGSDSSDEYDQPILSLNPGSSVAPTPEPSSMTTLAIMLSGIVTVTIGAKFSARKRLS